MSDAILCCDCEGTRSQLSTLYETIRRARVPANFFFTGVTARYMPDIVRNIARHFQVESHTMTHPNLRTLSKARQRQEILGGKHAVENAIGRATRGFRAPMHHLNSDTVDILNEEGFVFDASRLYFRHDMRGVIEIDPTWFREWMPLYERLSFQPRTAFKLFRTLTKIKKIAVLPLHPHYSGKSPEMAEGLAWFLEDARKRGVRFRYIDDWLEEKHGTSTGAKIPQPFQ